jgi:hypothetical protein
VNYVNTFIQVAPDTAAKEATVPAAKAGKRTIAVIEYELIADSPYAHTHEEVQFAVHVRRQEVSERELKVRRDELWREFFSKSRACMRTSPLAKNYGWGLHFNAEGKVALLPLGSADYKRFASSRSITQTRAMRNKRA